MCPSCSLILQNVTRSLYFSVNFSMVFPQINMAIHFTYKYWRGEYRNRIVSFFLPIDSFAFSQQLLQFLPNSPDPTRLSFPMKKRKRRIKQQQQQQSSWKENEIKENGKVRRKRRTHLVNRAFWKEAKITILFRYNNEHERMSSGITFRFYMLVWMCVTLSAFTNLFTMLERDTLSVSRRTPLLV